MQNNEYIPENKPLSIKDWSADDLPREKLTLHGASTLSDSELLAIILAKGTKGLNVIDLSKEMLKKFGGLNNLASADLSEFKHFRGVGPTKAVTLAAVFEMGKRIEAQPFWKNRVVRSPDDIARSYIPRFIGKQTEVFKVLLLNSANVIFREITVSEGTLNASLVHPREVFRLAITERAASIIVMHNHPSGNQQPSQSDIEITNQLVEAGKIIGIQLVDHLIIAGDSYFSFVKKGLL